MGDMGNKKKLTFNSSSRKTTTPQCRLFKLIFLITDFFLKCTMMHFLCISSVSIFQLQGFWANRSYIRPKPNPYTARETPLLIR